MRRSLRLTILVLAVFLWACSESTPQPHPKPSSQTQSTDAIISVAADDAEMNAAIAKARETLPQFWHALEAAHKNETDFNLKVKITDPNGVEYFWVGDIQRKDGRISGTINNDAETVKTVKLGDRITIPEADIADWLYMRDGKIVGNYTLRALFKHMSASEVEEAKKSLANP